MAAIEVKVESKDMDNSTSQFIQN